MNVRRAYYVIGSLNWFAAVLPMAVMVLLAQARGLSLSQIGLYLGLYSLVIILLELPSGALADTVGRKRVLLVAYALAAVSRLVFLVAFDLPAFLLYAVLHGVSRALSSGALEAWFIDALQAEDPDVELQPALAVGNSFQLAGLALGTLAGGLLPQLFAHLPTEGSLILTPLSTTVVASIVLQLGVVALTALVMREERPAVSGATGPAVLGAGVTSVGIGAGTGPGVGAGIGSGMRVSIGASLRKGLASLRQVLADAYQLTRDNRTLRLLLCADLVVGIVLMGSELLWQPFYAQSVGLGADDTLVLGVVLAGCFGMGIFGNLAATPLSRLLKKRYGLVAGLFQVLQGGSFVLLAWQTDLVLATACYWSTYLMRSAWSSPQATLYNQQVPAARRSVMLSVQSLVGFGGSFLGSVLLGPLAQATSISLAWVVCGGLVALSVFLYLAIDRARAVGAVSVRRAAASHGNRHL